MIYFYNKQSREFKRIKFSKHSHILISLISILITLGAVSQVKTDSRKEFTEQEIQVIFAIQNEFTEDKLISKLKELKFKFPHIVLAQAKLETGNFSSKMFNENNNLFGMKEAQMRLSTAGGSQYGHAYYNTWMESIYDYALYSSTYLHKIKNEKDYFSYLSQSYAEDPNYVQHLKGIIERDELKSLF